mmetsp:Transcript_143454/g.260934  ORF Transcript_143454/g.260934 Transcript_143454/m.260934 type:complete len:798 (-) Transcript_143454:60-2453(-)
MAAQSMHKASTTSVFFEEEELDRREVHVVSELRNQEAKYSNCCVWEIEDPPNVQDEIRNRRGHLPHVIRFGSSTDCMVHAVIRLVVLADLMLVPFVICFEYVYPLHANMVVHMVDGLTTFLYTVCVLQAFWTSYIDPKEMVEVKDPYKIQLHVACSHSFLLDVVSICSTPALYTHTHIRWFAVLRLIKCRRLVQDNKRVMLLDETSSILPKLASIVLVVYVCAHLYACAWFKAKVVSARGYGREWTAWNGWSQDVFDEEHVNLDSYSLPIEPGDLTDLLVCYCRALRDGCFMVVTWGSPNALSFVEMGTLIVLGPVLSCVMAYVFGYIVTIIGNATTMQDRLAKQMHVLNAACLDMRVHTSLRLRICRYHSYKLAHHMDADAQTLFDELSPNLASETRVYRMRHMILSADVFQGLTPRLILILLSTSTEHLFSPGDLIVRRGEIADCMYIVMNGILSVLVGPDADVVVKKLHDNQMFGEACFLSDSEPRMAFVRAETFSVLSRFDRDSFDHVMVGHQDLKDDIKEAILRTINKYKAPANPNSPASPKSPHEPVLADEYNETAKRISLLANPSEQLAVHDPTTSSGIRELCEVGQVEKDNQDACIKSPTLSLNGVLAQTHTPKQLSPKHPENHYASNAATTVTNGIHASNDDVLLATDMVHKTSSINVISTQGFRASALPGETIAERSESRGKSALKKPSCVAAVSTPEVALGQPTTQLHQLPLSLQSEAQQAARQALAKFSIGRTVQREAIAFLKQKVETVAADCRPVLANQCEALLGQLMCLEVAQKRLEGMINLG